MCALVVVVLAGCGGKSQPKRVPDLRGDRLDFAEARLDALGLDWEEFGGGNLGIVLRSRWIVCAGAGAGQACGEGAARRRALV
jgi:hypothetical protein